MGSLRLRGDSKAFSVTSEPIPLRYQRYACADSIEIAVKERLYKLECVGDDDVEDERRRVLAHPAGL